MAPAYPFCNYHPGIPCMPKGRKVSAAEKGGAVERQWEGSSLFVHRYLRASTVCQEKVPSAGAHSLAQPCPFPHEASRLVEQPDFERAIENAGLFQCCLGLSALQCPVQSSLQAADPVLYTEGGSGNHPVFCCEHNYGTHLMLPVILLKNTLLKEGRIKMKCVHNKEQKIGMWTLSQRPLKYLEAFQQGVTSARQNLCISK